MGRWIAIGLTTLLSLGLGAGLGLLIHQLPVGLVAAIGLPLGHLRWDRPGPLEGGGPDGSD